MPPLNGQTLFITRASRGIALAIALRAAPAGAHVATAAKTHVPNTEPPSTPDTPRRLSRGWLASSLALPTPPLPNARTMPTLNGPTLCITSSARGIGLAIARRAARDGANVASAAKSYGPNPNRPGSIHTAAQAVDVAGGRGLALKCDIR